MITISRNALNGKSCNLNIILFFNFLCFRSPDGTELLANMEGGHFLTFKWTGTELELMGKLKGHLSGFNDFDWYPWMNSNLEGSDIFLTSSKDLPLQLWSRNEGKVICSWTAKDHLDQVANCLSVTFSPDGQKVLSGGEGKIWLFETGRPGENSISQYSTSQNKKSITGQKGIISCLNFRFDNTGVFASGSFKGSIGIYDLRSIELKGDVCCVFKAHKNGVSQVKFLNDGWSIISSGRRDDTLKKWDLRMLQEMDSPVSEYKSAHYTKTNQRIFFDSDMTNLYTGFHNSLIKFDLRSGEIIDSSCLGSTVSSVSLDNKCGILAASTGTRRFDLVCSDSESDIGNGELSNYNSKTHNNSISLMR